MQIAFFTINPNYIEISVQCNLSNLFKIEYSKSDHVTNRFAKDLEDLIKFTLHVDIELLLYISHDLNETFQLV